VLLLAMSTLALAALSVLLRRTGSTV